MSLHVVITAYIEPKEAVKRIVNITTIIADLAFFSTKTPDLAPNAEHGSIRSAWLQR